MLADFEDDDDQDESEGMGTGRGSRLVAHDERVQA
jgi:hypothetical protein